MPSINHGRRKFLINAGVVATGLTAASSCAGYFLLSRPAFGSVPAGKRLLRIQGSPNWQDGAFQNLAPMQQAPDNRSQFAILKDFLLDTNPARFPSHVIPHDKANLAAIRDNTLVWLGHSGFFIRLQGVRILIDPALNQAFPFAGFYKPFPGADIYHPGDLPQADVLLISHDHYDHLDYATVIALRDRVARVVCPLGVGAHFEAWGWEPERITELDWWEETRAQNIRITAVPGQHFSGRGLKRNQTLWAGYVLQAGGYSLYHSGDSSSGPHFSQIANAFPLLDLALLEDGQYNVDWPGVHMLPQAWRNTVATLRARCVMPIHNSKFCLARHAWQEPLNNALHASKEMRFSLATPRIGSEFPLDPANDQATEHWWQMV